MFAKYKLIPIFIGLFLILPFMSSLVGFYTDWLFFVETGFASAQGPGQRERLARPRRIELQRQNRSVGQSIRSPTTTSIAAHVNA